jgi:HAD superfamily phosphatase (TIGR01668 family)
VFFCFSLYRYDTIVKVYEDGRPMLKLLMPKEEYQSIYEIDLKKLKRQGIRGIISDLDNTLIEWNADSPGQPLMKWIGEVRSEGIALIILSNNSEQRVADFAKRFDLPFIFRAKKPLHFSFRRALQAIGTSPEQTAMLGDQIFTDVLGGNWLGLHTILVKPIANNDAPATRMNRLLERLFVQRKFR